ncbi:MAG: response regulator [Planctomycetota bacterium]
MAGPGKTILVVEDDDAVRGVFAGALEAHDVLEARCVTDAIRLLQTHRVDLVITDIHMPGMNGIEFIEHVRAAKPGLPVVVVSGQITPATREALVRLSPAALLGKPVGVKALQEVVEVTLREVRGTQGRILVVDDNASIRDLLRGVLERAGFTVEEAPDGEIAVAMACRGGYAMVFMDINLPSISGGEATRRIRERAPETLVILITGEAGVQAIDEAYRGGGYTLLRKPFYIEHLLAALPSYLRESRRLAEDVKERAVQRREPVWRRLPRAVRKFRGELRQNSRKREHVRAVVIAGVALLVGLLALQSYVWIRAFVEKRVNRVDDAIGRLEGYLERDETREIRRDTRGR